MDGRNNIEHRLRAESAFFGVFFTIAATLLVYLVCAEHNFVWDLPKAAYVGAAGITLALALWRAHVADKQSQTANRRADTAEAGLNIDRFQKGVALLDDESPGTWLAGLQTLRDLALSDPANHYRQVVEQLCEFVTRQTQPAEADFEEKLKLYWKKSDEYRRRVSDKIPATAAGDPPMEPRPPACPPDAVRAANMLSELLSNDSVRTRASLPDGLWPSMPRANFRNANLYKFDWRTANLAGADFTGAHIDLMRFEGTFLASANFTSAHLWEPDLKGARIQRANVTGLQMTVMDESVEFTLSGTWHWEDDPPECDPRCGGNIHKSVSMPLTMLEEYSRSRRRGVPSLRRWHEHQKTPPHGS